MRIVTVRAMGIARNGYTKKGNTRWLLVDENHQQWHTASDAAIAGHFTNADVLGDLPAWVELAIDSKQRIVGVTRIEGER